MKLTLEKRTILIISVFVALNLLIVGAIIVPTARSIQKSEQQTLALRQYLEKRYQRAENLRSSLKKIGVIRAATATYPDHLFTKGDELKLITTLEAMAAKNNVTQKVTNSNLDSLAGQRLAMSLLITGNYQDVLHYLADLEALPYFLNVDGLQFSPLSDRLSLATGGTPAALNLDLSLYVN